MFLFVWLYKGADLEQMATVFSRTGARHGCCIHDASLTMLLLHRLNGRRLRGWITRTRTTALEQFKVEDIFLFVCMCKCGHGLPQQSDLKSRICFCLCASANALTQSEMATNSKRGPKNSRRLMGLYPIHVVRTRRVRKNRGSPRQTDIHSLYTVYTY